MVVTHQAEKIWMYDRTTVWPYDRMTIQGATFNMCGQLYCGHVSSPVVSALGSESDDPGFSPGQGKVLCPWDMRGKKMRAPLFGWAKSIYCHWKLTVGYQILNADCLQVTLIKSCQCSCRLSGEHLVTVCVIFLFNRMFANLLRIALIVAV